MTTTAPPRRFGPFTLLEPLAEGGMGALWLAGATGLPGAPDLCVVKVMRSAVADADAADAVQRFLPSDDVLTTTRARSRGQAAAVRQPAP